MRKILGCFIILLMNFGCADDGERIMEIVGDSYFPLHVGDKWQYRPANEEYPQMNEHIPDVTREIKGIEVKEGREYFFMLITYDYSKQSLSTQYDSAYYRFGDHGFVYEFDKKMGTETNPYRLNANDGDHWVLTNRVGTGEISVRSIEKLDLDGFIVSDCKRYYFDIGHMADEENYTVLGPGIGIVSQGNAWGFDMKLKKATIAGRQYEF